jgi:hypothetical protein
MDEVSRRWRRGHHEGLVRRRDRWRCLSRVRRLQGCCAPCFELRLVKLCPLLRHLGLPTVRGWMLCLMLYIRPLSDCLSSPFISHRNTSDSKVASDMQYATVRLMVKPCGRVNSIYSKNILSEDTERTWTTYSEFCSQ